jgi:exosome complex exonuclease RRP6
MNNYLFQLAEQPPADMAAFLATFKSVPPVIRRRAKELFDIIQETVKKYRGRVKLDEASVVAASDKAQDTPMEVEATTSTSTDSRLWSKGPSFP